jgi:hypothetical protein
MADKDRPAFVEQLLVSCRTISNDSDRANALLSIAKHAPEGRQNQVLNEAIEAARAGKNDAVLSTGYASLSRFLDVANRKIAVNRALAIARDSEMDDWQRAITLVHIANALPPEDRAHVISIMVDRIQYEGTRAYCFEHVIRLLSGPEVSVATEAISSFNDESERAHALAALLLCVPDNEQEGMLRSFLSSADKMPRFDLLRALSKLVPVLSRLEGVDGLNELRRAILDVGRWFP